MSDKYAMFGPAGNSDSFTARFRSSLDAPAWLYDLGLDTYEYQCGKGVHIGAATAEALGTAAAEKNIRMSLHSPYFISLTNLENLDKNIGYVLQSCAVAKCLGATRIVVHSGAAGKRERGEALKDAIYTLGCILREMDGAGYTDIALCPETMGKINQLGNFEEVMEICRSDERLVPCIDFGHLYARTLGGLEGEEETAKLFDAMENALGVERASCFHSHFSKIEYTKGGEKRHLTFASTEFGPEFRPVARLIARRGYYPTFICESSGTQAEDALEMKHIYYEEMERII